MEDTQENQNSIIDEILGDSFSGDHSLEELRNNGFDLNFSLNLLVNNFLIEQIRSKPHAGNIEVMNNDFFNAILIRISTLKALAKREEDEELIQEINDTYHSILLQIANALEIQFKFSFNEKTQIEKDDLNIQELEKNIHEFYRFCVLERIQYLSAFISQYILNHAKELVKIHRKTIDSRKKYSLSSLKEHLKNFDDVLLMHSIPDSISIINETEIKFSDFMELLKKEFGGDFCLETIEKIIDEDNEEFVKNFISITKTDIIKNSVSSDVRAEIFANLEKN
jgi:hypothetical protein